MFKPTSFKRKLLATSIASALVGFSVSAFADDVEEVVVLGVKGAQVSAVNTKRNAASVVDSIAAEDIGKLPDATISDSLQRIPGIQIRRNAGEGGQVNVRGFSQVTALLNGEAYLGANSITTVQPNFGDIPSQLFKGADVIKSPTGSLLGAGLSGTVDLKTRRPFDFADGFSGAAAAEVGQGTMSQEMDPSINGLINWKNDKVGILFAASSQKSNNANSYEGKLYGPGLGADGFVTEGSSMGGDYGGTFVGDGDTTTNEQFYAPEGWANYHKFTERDRKGFNTSFQVDLGEGFQLVADYFYTHQDQWDRTAGMVAETKWSNCCSFNNFSVAKSAPLSGATNAASVIDYMPRRVQSYSEVFEFFSQSQDTNLELKYDNGGAFTADVRYVVGNASQHNLNNYLQADLVDGGPTNTNVWTDGTLGNRLPGTWVNPNPNGFKGVAQIRIDHSGSNPVWSGWDKPLVDKLPNATNGTRAVLNGGKTLGAYAADVNSYNVAAISSEGNYDRDGSLEVKRADMHYKFADSFVTSVDWGLRFSDRTADNSVWHGVSNFYAGKGGVKKDGTPNPQGCLARWKATDIHFGDDCQVGEMIGGNFVPWTAIGNVKLSTYKTVKVDDWGNVKGMPTFIAADPHILDDVKGFHTKFYGNYIKSIDPGASYNVDLSDTTGYIQGNFAAGAVSGNVGVRIVSTELTVNQNLVGSSRSYGMAALDGGDLKTKRSYKDVLPAVNLAYDVTEEFKLRAAYSKNMTALDLNSWGQAVTTNYSQSAGDGIWHINSVNYGGNPGLDPWRSTNAEVSAEWYLSPGSVISLGFFQMDIKSFPASDNTPGPFPDLDGVVRNPLVPTTRTINGKGGSLDGVELAAKYAFDQLPGFWSHFGIDANLTLTNSEDKGLKDTHGDHPGMGDNSKTQYNLVLWYQDDALQARIAYNYRDKRVAGGNMGVGGGLSAIYYQDAVGYLDASVSYDVTKDWTVYMNASNITGEYEKYFLENKAQYIAQQYYEPRYTIGVRTRF